MFRIKRISRTPGQSHPTGFTGISDYGQWSYAGATSRIITVDFFQLSTSFTLFSSILLTVGGFPLSFMKPPEIAEG
ncbi:MAG: hypothetical protein WCJ93_11120 [Methanomicrobiales archaeon]